MVADAWVQTAKASSRATRSADKGAFFKHHHKIVSGILGRAEIRIAAPPDDDFTILGFAVVEPGTIHMVYVKAAFRRLGLARALLGEIQPKQSTFTYWTKDVQDWLWEKYRGIKYNPFISEVL